jgi:hypothetical protein
VGTLGACSIECHFWKIQIKDELQLTNGPYNSLARMIYQNHIDSSEWTMDLKIGHWVYKAQISLLQSFGKFSVTNSMIKKIHKNLKKSNKSLKNRQISIHGSSR